MKKTENKKPILSKIIIRLIHSSDSLDELTALLHASYKKLADKGFKFHASHQDVNTTKQRIENAECYVALLNDKLIVYASLIVVK